MLGLEWRVYVEHGLYNMCTRGSMCRCWLESSMLGCEKLGEINKEGGLLSLAETIF